MAHSVELVFDAATDAAVRAEWDALAAAGLPSQARHTSATNRPHVTLVVSGRIDAGVDPLLAEPAATLPLPCRLGAPMVFGHRRSVTLVRLVVPDAALLALHRRVFDVTLPHQNAGPFPHAVPGGWTPHVTLCRRLPLDDLPAALRLLDDGDDVAGVFAGMRRWDGDAKVDTHIR